MAVTLTGTNGLFTRIGRLGGRVNSILNGQGAAALTAPSVSAGVAYTNLLAQFTSGSAQSDEFDTYYNNVVVPSRGKSQEIASIKTFAQAWLVRQVSDDTPLRQNTVQYAMAELLRQMGPNVSDSKVSANTTSATTPTANSGNTGTALVISSIVGPLMPNVENTQGSNAMNLQNIFPETIVLKCTDNSQLYQEGFSVISANQITADPLTWNFTSLYGAPATNGSGISTNINVCNAAAYAGSGGNLLNNGDFSQYPGAVLSNAPNQWTAVAGSAGVDFLGIGGASITGGTCLKLLFAGNAVTFTQQFGNAGGTLGILQPNTVYAFNMDAKKDSGATGTITIDLIDGSNNVIADNNAVNNTLAFTGANTGTTYTNGSQVGWGFFRTPNSLPSVYKIRFRTTANIATAALYLSNFSLRPALQPYPGSGYLAMFSKATGNAVGDSYNAIFANNFGGLTNKAGFMTLFNWLFDMRANGLGQLPILGTNLIADSLVA